MRLAGVHANQQLNDFLITRALREKCGKCLFARILRKALGAFVALFREIQVQHGAVRESVSSDFFKRHADVPNRRVSQRRGKGACWHTRFSRGKSHHGLDCCFKNVFLMGTRTRVQCFNILSHMRWWVHSKYPAAPFACLLLAVARQAAVQRLHSHMPDAVQLLAFSRMKCVERISESLYFVRDFLSDTAKNA